MTSLAVTVVGHDRPGIVAEVTAAIADLGGNLEDSSMSLLRGHFAMTLIADVPGRASDLSGRLGHLRGEGLSVSVLEVPRQEPAPAGVGAVLSVHGADRPGIVSAAAAAVARRGGNITDLATRLGPHMYVMTADVTFPPGSDLGEAAAELAEAVVPLGVRATLRPADEDLL
jgi:glycine cleavage system transcriptional repressor